MPRISTFAFALVALVAFNSAQAALSLPIAEAGFALASNGGADTITTPTSSDQGGGTLHPSEAAVETPGNDTAHSEAAGGSSHEERAQKAAPVDNGTVTNSTTTTHKARGNVHWQALLPGLMR